MGHSKNRKVGDADAGAVAEVTRTDDPDVTPGDCTSPEKQLREMENAKQVAREYGPDETKAICGALAAAGAFSSDLNMRRRIQIAETNLAPP